MMRYAVIEDGTVVNVILWDGIGDMFDAQTLIELPDDSLVGPGWSHDGTDFVAPPAPEIPPVTEGQALAEKSARIAYATTRIAPLQDMVDLGEATPEEEAALLAWKRYRIALTRITSTSAGWPSAVQWPAMPT